MRKTQNKTIVVFQNQGVNLLSVVFTLLFAVAFSSVASAGFAGDQSISQTSSAESLWQSSYTESNKKQFIVKLKTPVASLGMLRMALFAGNAIEQVNEKANYIVISLDGNLEQVTDQLSEVLANPEVEYAVPNLNVQALDLFLAGEPNDPKYGKQYALEKVNAENAWTHTKGSKDIVVAVIDSGVDYEHEDLKSQIWTNTAEIAGNDKDDDDNGFVDDVRGWDFDGGDNDPMDETSSGFFGFGGNPGHGTHCAGIIGATGDNEIGISGMAQNISIMPIRFLNKHGSGNLNNAVKAIDYAVENGAHIISASWGGSFPESISTPIGEAIERAEKAGVLFIAAAANSGKDNDSNNFFPTNAPYENVISVAATGETDRKADFSNYGIEKVHLGAPGVDILSTLPGDEYKTLSGTSMAAPLVAGMIALQFSLTDDKVRRDPNAVKALLQSTGMVNDMEVACNCRVDAGAALDNISNDELLIIPNTVSAQLGSEIELSAIGGTAPYRFDVTDQKVGSIDIKEDGKVAFVGSSAGNTKVVAYDSTGKRVTTGLIRINDGAASKPECTLGDFLCGLQCFFDPSKPWCED